MTTWFIAGSYQFHHLLYKIVAGRFFTKAKCACNSCCELWQKYFLINPTKLKDEASDLCSYVGAWFSIFIEKMRSRCSWGSMVFNNGAWYKIMVRWWSWFIVRHNHWTGTKIVCFGETWNWSSTACCWNGMTYFQCTSTPNNDGSNSLIQILLGVRKGVRVRCACVWSIHAGHHSDLMKHQLQLYVVVEMKYCMARLDIFFKSSFQFPVQWK